MLKYEEDPIHKFKDFFITLSFWILNSVIIGSLAGSASAFFLWTLDWITKTRENHFWLLYFLPLGGLLVVFLYSRYGHKIERGNNLILDEIHQPQVVIPFRMAPLVYAGTLLTHLFGGSAGREGTAVQMAAALADRWAAIFKKFAIDRQQILMMGMSAGFASVFGTPLAGAVFGLEVLTIGRIRYSALLPCLLSAIIAHAVCLAWGITHTAYNIVVVPDLNAISLLQALVAGALFGLCAWAFSSSQHNLSSYLKRSINSPYLRVVLGAIVVIVLTLILQNDRYLGLGIPAIADSFFHPSPSYDFALKMLFTVITLSVGFKGGEVTPLFFIGATLGSFLSTVFTLPTGLLAGMGFVAVFAGAANTPLASLLMALEMFGSTPAIYMAIACITSYIFSGHTGIYSSQKIEVRKYAEKN